MIGPNVRKLIFQKAAIIMIPPGTPAGHGMRRGLEALIGGEYKTAIPEATEWVREAIAAVKAAPGNKWGDDDEAIAGEILRQIEERKRNQRK